MEKRSIDSAFFKPCWKHKIFNFYKVEHSFTWFFAKSKDTYLQAVFISLSNDFKLVGYCNSYWAGAWIIRKTHMGLFSLWEVRLLYGPQEATNCSALYL